MSLCILKIISLLLSYDFLGTLHFLFGRREYWIILFKQWYLFLRILSWNNFWTTLFENSWTFLRNDFSRDDLDCKLRSIHHSRGEFRFRRDISLRRCKRHMLDNLLWTSNWRRANYPLFNFWIHYYWIVNYFIGKDEILWLNSPVMILIIYSKIIGRIRS